MFHRIIRNSRVCLVWDMYVLEKSETHVVFFWHVFFPQVSDDEEDEMCSDMNSLSQNDKSESSSVPKRDSRKEKSLGLLTQNFVKLFLCTDVSVD